MAQRRGFFAEMQRQARLAEQQRLAAERIALQRQRVAEKAQLSAYRAAEVDRKRAEREAAGRHLASKSAYRAAEVDRKRAEREAAGRHLASKQAEVDALNAEVSERYEELDGLMTATLAVDDFVDLETLRVVVAHPPFQHENLRQPLPPPDPLTDPPPPVRAEVPEPSGLFGRKRKLAEAQAAVEAQYTSDYAQWQAQLAALPTLRATRAEHYAAQEKARKEKLAEELASYELECAERESKAREQNAALDELITGLGYGTVEAVQEYVGIVLANSVYPQSFPVSHTEEFDPSTAELILRVVIPGPDQIPTIKAYKYTKSTDEITSTSLPQKAIKDRYAGIVHAVALRSLHEVFEADRRGLIKAISLELGTNTLSPATGRDTYVPFVFVAAERSAFEQVDLSAVVPAATLEHLGAVVSKNPFSLVPASGSGIRRLG